MAVDKQKMEDNFNNIPIEELADIINNKPDDYDEDAIKMAYKILKERQWAGSKPTENITIEDATREVHLTDIRMPFMSMVMFMVKWAIATIPAFIILLVLGFALASFIGVGVVSLFK